MGRDKALLPLGDATLIERIAAQVLGAAGNVTLIGPPERYQFLGYPVVADKVPGCGPLGGLYTALSITSAERNLIVACDMPGLTKAFLKQLLEASDEAAADVECLVPQSAAGLEPLCAVYHRRCLVAAEHAVSHKLLKMHDFVNSLKSVKWPVFDPSALKNVNRPEDWETA